MILTVDFNPTLKRKYIFDKIDNRGANTPLDTNYGAGGEGIEMSYLLNALNEEVKVCGCLGGINGTYIQHYLTQLKIPNSFIPIKDDTPETIILKSKDEEVLINSREQRITRDELENFYESYNRKAMGADMICLIGKIPSSMPKEIVYYFVQIAKKYDLQIFLKLKGEELRYVLDTEPCFLLIDKEDLEDLTKLRLGTVGEVIRASRYIMDRGVKKLAINLDNKGSILITENSYYRINILDNEKAFETNSAYMLGGYALSISRGYDIEMTAKLGQACGIGNSYVEDEIKDMGDIKYIMNEIEVKKYDY